MTVIARALPLLAALVATVLLGAMAAALGAYYYLRPGLPSVAEMRDIPLQIPLRIYSRDGRLIQQVGEKRRTPVAYENIPRRVVLAFLAAEDDRFFEHPGFDYQGIMRASLNLARTGTRAQGGSTITQQLAREYFLTRDRTFVRKAKELILAVQIEQAFTKEEILSLYLNKIFLGQRAYGIVAAAEVYFGKSLDELTIAEAATIAGLPAAPSRLNPVSSPEQARDRRSYVLRRMREQGYISEAEYAEAIATPVLSKLHAPAVELDAPYVAEMARSEIVRLFGEEAYEAGYQVITTIDSRLQQAATGAVRTALLDYDRRHGYRGALDRIDIDQVVAAYRDSRSTLPVSLQDDPVALADQALQDRLGAWTDYAGLRPAVVLSLSVNDNAATFFVRDRGRVSVPWERLRWRPYINDNAMGAMPANVEALLKPGDVVYLIDTVNGLQLAQVPQAQAAFAAVDPRDGAILALSGGFDFRLSKFNRAVQARRQPGSAFKPFIYSAALEHGFTAATIVNDAPIVLPRSGQSQTWRPENYSNQFYGPTPFREALVRSMNLVSLRVLQSVGMNPALRHLRRFGFDDTALPADLALALGSGGVSVVRMATAYSSFANSGLGVDDYLVERIVDAYGKVLYEADAPMACERCAPVWADGFEPAPGPGTLISPETLFPGDEVPAYGSVAEMLASAGNWKPDYRETPLFFAGSNAAPRVISAQNAYIMYDMMRDVIQRGTGQRARALGRSDLAGKTGTSNNRRDAWFAGFNSGLTAVAWMGFDDDARSLGTGEEGSRSALPMWNDFIGMALRNLPEAPPVMPPGIVSARVSPATGMAPRPGEEGRFELFIAGTEPRASTEDALFGSDPFGADGGSDSIF